MAVRTVTPQDVFSLRREGNPFQFIDVRTPREFDAVHAEGARGVPLDQLDAKAMATRAGIPPDEPLYIICQSGGRAAKACEQLEAAGFTEVFNVEGGTAAWQSAGLPVVRGAVTVMSLERQVRIVAGAIVLLGNVLGWYVHPALHGISALIGAGLLFAGATDWCGMGMLLAKMPWNRRANADFGTISQGDGPRCAS